MKIDDLKAPDFDSAEGKHAFLGEVFEGKRDFPLMNGGMGVDFSSKEFVSEMLRLRYIGVLSGAWPGYKAILQDLSCLSVRERSQLLMAESSKELSKMIEYVRSKCRHGILGINCMYLLDNFNEKMRVAGTSGEVDLFFAGAGIPHGATETMAKYSDMGFVPIVSPSRVVRIMEKAAGKEGRRRPDAYYVELPHLAGGHLGATNLEDAVNADMFKPDVLRREIRELVPNTPVILAGGIAYRDQIAKAFADGYQGVAMGTRLLLTRESGLEDDIITNVYLNQRYRCETGMKSPAGFPSRYLVVPEELLESRERGESVRNAMRECVDCIGKDKCKLFTEQCAPEEKLHYCIIRELAKTRLGIRGGLYFTGSVVEQIRSDDLYSGDGRPYVPSLEEAIVYSLTHDSPV